MSWASDPTRANLAGYLGLEAQHPDYSGELVLYVVYGMCTYIIYFRVPRQEHGLKTKAWRKMSATRHPYQGKLCLEIHLVKPARLWQKLRHRRSLVTSEWWVPTAQPKGHQVSG